MEEVLLDDIRIPWDGKRLAFHGETPSRILAFQSLWGLAMFLFP